MRRLCSLVAVVVALAPLACGAPVSDTGNVFVTEQAVETVAGAGDTVRVTGIVPINIDESDPGCTVDGQRFAQCYFTTTTTVGFNGPMNLCELAVGEGEAHVWECTVGKGGETVIERFDELPAHCPTSGR